MLDHLAEFGTLKTMGYGDSYLRMVVVVEAWALSLIGFLPSVLVGAIAQQALGYVTGLPAHFSWTDSAFVLLLSLAMCSAAGTFALRRTKEADPADLF